MLVRSPSAATIGGLWSPDDVRVESRMCKSMTSLVDFETRKLDRRSGQGDFAGEIAMTASCSLT